MIASEEKIKTWIATLLPEQKDELIINLIDFAITAEVVAFHDDSDNLAPYWDGDGEPIVPDQVTWKS